MRHTPCRSGSVSLLACNWQAFADGPFQPSRIDGDAEFKAGDATFLAAQQPGFRAAVSLRSGEILGGGPN